MGRWAIDLGCRIYRSRVIRARSPERQSLAPDKPLLTTARRSHPSC
jgi:hypothetical protein